MSLLIEKVERDYLLRLVCGATPINNEDIRVKLQLKQKLGNSLTCSRNEIPNNVVLLGRIFSIKTNFGRRLNLKLVLPNEEDVSKNKISIFSSLGSAIYGHKTGDLFKWRVAENVEEVEVLHVQTPNKTLVLSEQMKL